MNKLICVLAFFFTSCTFAAQEYYVWVDEDGVTNYAEKSPRGYDARHITPTHKFGERLSEEAIDEGDDRRPGRTAEPASTTTEVDPDALIADETARIARELASQKRSNCEIGKKNLTNLTMFQRISVTDDNGAQRFLTQEEKATKMEEARKVIRENCAG